MILQDDYLKEVADEYEEIRKEYYESLKEKKFVSLDKARKNKYKIDWKTYRPVKPNNIGIFNITGNIKEIAEYIDWIYFFIVWGIRGKYPNRSFPKIFNDPTVGVEAKKLYDDVFFILLISKRLKQC